MSSEKSKTVEEQLRFSSLIWSAVRLVDYPRRICLSKPKSFIRSWHPIKASYYLYIAFRLAKNRVSFRRNLNAASVHVFDHLAAWTKMIFLDKFLKIFRRFNRTSGFRFVSFRFLEKQQQSRRKSGSVHGSNFFSFSVTTFHRYLEIENTTEHIARD